MMVRHAWLTFVNGGLIFQHGAPRYMHFNRGAPKVFEVYVTQVPRGTNILLSTRYPAGTSFQIRRIFNWFPHLNAQLWRASTMKALQQSDGQAYHFDGRWLTLKIVDPGDPAAIDPLEWKGIKVSQTRFYDLRYKVCPDESIMHDIACEPWPFTGCATAGPWFAE